MKPNFLMALCAFGASATIVQMASTQTAAQQVVSTSTPAESITLAPVRLRGYGLVSGVQRSSLGGATLLRIETENAQKAQLLQAKFVSDFGLLPGVHKTDVSVGAISVVAYEAQAQGSVVALRNGKTVFLVASSNRTRLIAIVRTLPVAAQKSSRPEVSVPMWLDRWDKFNFRHYYRAWETPANHTGKYDYINEFDYAKAQDRAGFVFWNDALSNDTAEGMMNYGWWDWANEEARKRELPVGINLSGATTSWMLNRYRDQVGMKMPGFTGNYRDLKSPYLGGTQGLSWHATTGQEATLALLQKSVRRFVAQPNVTSFLEPHGELNHGPQDILLEYGPVADANYRRYLQGKYRTPNAVATRWGRTLESWNEVRVPELASFAGWGPQAMDLGGMWRIGYEELEGSAPSAYYYDRFGAPKSNPAPEQWFQPDF
jgi:hypothetical protein